MLEHPIPIKTYTVGVIAPRSFVDCTILAEAIAENSARISHIYTNNVKFGGETVQEYANRIGVAYTVFPIVGLGGALISNSRIISSSDFIFILTDGQSKNAELAKTDCEKKGKKYKLIEYVAVPSLSSQVNKARLLINQKLLELATENAEGEPNAKFLTQVLKTLEDK